MQEKVSKISSLTSFFTEKNHRIENRFPVEIYNGEYLRLFSNWKSLWQPRAIVQGVQALGQGQNGHIVKRY